MRYRNSLINQLNGSVSIDFRGYDKFYGSYSIFWTRRANIVARALNMFLNMVHTPKYCTLTSFGANTISDRISIWKIL